MAELFPVPVGNGHRLKDMTGQRFGRLYVLERRPSSSSMAAWLCRCDCGKMYVTLGSTLRKGHIQSCGCYAADLFAARFTKHGMATTKLYKVWAGMKKRCQNPNSPMYARYGARGIDLCDKWQTFEGFYEDMGDRPSDKHSIDRINNDLGYSPENCRWVTSEVQASNRSSTVIVEACGEKLSVTQWARKAGISMHTLVSRLKRGVPLEEALSKTKLKRQKRSAL